MARLENIAILIYISQMQENIYLLRDQTIETNEAKSILKLSPNKIDQSINIMVGWIIYVASTRCNHAIYSLIKKQK